LFINGVIFQTQCVYFEIKKEQITIPLISDYTTQHCFFHELNATIFHRFLAANYYFVLSFFAARKVFEKFINESLKSTKNTLIE
jgi:hypothetical protein